MTTKAQYHHSAQKEAKYDQNLPGSNRHVYFIFPSTSISVKARCVLMPVLLSLPFFSRVKCFFPGALLDSVWAPLVFPL